MGFGLIILTLFFCLARSETFCPYVNSYGEDRRTHTDKLTIMQYNVEWAFLDYNANADCPGNGCVWANETQSVDHMDHVSNIIRKFNPDIINFCEIQGCDELNYLRDHTTSNYNSYMIQGTDTATGQNVGMLTKLEIFLKKFKCIYTVQENIH